MSTLWTQLFANDAPVEIEIGPERGTFLFASATLHPQRNYLGIERSSNRARRMERTLRQSPLPNVHLICADAACVVANCIPPESVAAYHIYFPDPWWKRRHHRRRLLTPEFCASLAATLEPGGLVHFVTDVAELFQYAMKGLNAAPGLTANPSPASRPVRSAFEQKAVEYGSTLYEASLYKELPISSAMIGIGAP